jgi:hypothetical protein
MKHQRTEIEAQYAFSRKSKKYRTKYLDGLNKLYGEIESDNMMSQKASKSIKDGFEIKGNPKVAG